MDRWLISPVSIEMESEPLETDPTIQAERQEIVTRGADGTDYLYGYEQSYTVMLVSPRSVDSMVNVRINHNGRCIDYGQFKVKQEQYNIIRLSRIQPIN
jgi:hypothetical protein